MDAVLAVEAPAVGVRERLISFVGEVARELPHRVQRANAELYVRGLVEQTTLGPNVPMPSGSQGIPP